MFNFENEAAFVQDREDLIAVLRMRFGDISTETIEGIYELNELDTLERLILVAANAPTLQIFLEEMEEGDESFRITGERFNPLETVGQRGGVNEEK